MTRHISSLLCNLLSIITATVTVIIAIAATAAATTYYYFFFFFDNDDGSRMQTRADQHVPPSHVVVDDVTLTVTKSFPFLSVLQQYPVCSRSVSSPVFVPPCTVPHSFGIGSASRMESHDETRDCRPADQRLCRSVVIQLSKRTRRTFNG